MQRQRGELVPVGEVIADLGGPIQALRETPPPARRGFTLADQVNQLVSASEADADLGFMARTMALCSLPRSNPGNRKEYKRVNGPFTLYMVAGGGNKLPYGNLPRLLLAWVSTEAVRTQSRVLVLGKSLSEFMRALGIYSSHGRTQNRLRNQMDRLFHASVELNYEDKHGKQFIASRVVDRGEFWWNERKPDQPSLWDSEIRLGEDFFNEIVRHPVPLNMNTLTALKRSPLGLDLYLWLTYRTFALRAPLRLTWQQVYRPVRSGTGSGQRQSDRPSLPHKGSPRVEEDQAGLAGVELLDGQRGLDPLPLETRDCAHDRPTASRGVAPGSPRSDRTRAGCFRWRRDDVPWQSRKPTSERTTETGKFRRGPPADAVRALHSARATEQRQSVVPEMPPVPQEGPLTRPGATNAGRDTFSYHPNRRAA